MAAACLHSPDLPCAVRGYVLFDVLVAQLLLALSLLGGGLALTQAMAASRAAALQGTAVDLLADLAEYLHTRPVPASTVATWPARVARQLPGGEGRFALPDASEGADPVEATLRWVDPAHAQSLSMAMPIVPPAAPDPTDPP
jgi:Tfp pilus assembly protein PilV